MSERFSRRELVTGAAALMLGEKLAAAEAVAPKKKTYPVELADQKTVQIDVMLNATARTIVASDNGNVRLNMDDTLVVAANGTPFAIQLFPLNGGPAHPFVKWPGNVVDGVATFKGTRLEVIVREFTTLPLPFYQYNIEAGGQVLDPWIIIDGRAAAPWICTAGCKTP